MNLQTYVRPVTFAGQHYAIKCESSKSSESFYLGWQVEAVEEIPHGDWKTQSVRDSFMGMRKGETGILENMVFNFYSTWAKVRIAGRESTCDVDPKNLKVISYTQEGCDIQAGLSVVSNLNSDLGKIKPIRIFEGSRIIQDQPPPRPSEGTAIADLVIRDIEDRKKVGFERYGTLLRPFNGRIALVDAYQEVIDLSLYCRQQIEEQAQLLDAVDKAIAAYRSHRSDVSDDLKTALETLIKIRLSLP